MKSKHTLLIWSNESKVALGFKKRILFEISMTEFSCAIDNEFNIFLTYHSDILFGNYYAQEQIWYPIIQLSLSLSLSPQKP